MTFCDPRDGRIEIALTEREDALRIDVRDNGCGIDEADQRIIFDKFRQAGDTPADTPQGSGLGLYISRRIIERHGGSLRVESRPGEGACFSLSLPIAAPEEESRFEPAWRSHG